MAIRQLGRRGGFSAVLALGLVAMFALGAAPAFGTEPVDIVESVAVPGGPCGDPVLGAECQAYFPDLVRDPHGDGDDLLMVYRWSSAHSRMPSQLRMMRSRDGGATWLPTEPFIVAAFSDVDYRDPSLTVLRNGRLLLSYFVSDGRTAAIIQTQVKYRDADNAPFSRPVQVFSSTIPRPATSAKVLEVSNGQLLIPLYGTPSGANRHHAVIVASVDGGLTWDGRITGRQKTIASSTTLFYQEPALAEISPGHVRAVIRAATAVGPSITTDAVETDSYKYSYMTTWDPPTSLGVLMHGPEILTIPGTGHTGYLWSQPNMPSAPTNRPTRIAVRRSGHSWPDTPRHTLYDPRTTNDSGYPGTVVLGTGLVTVVYDEARRAALALRYNLANIDRSARPGWIAQVPDQRWATWVAGRGPPGRTVQPTRSSSVASGQ